MPKSEERSPAREAHIELRATARQDDLIRRAAAAVDRSVTEFVLDSATQRAEEILAEKRWFVLPDVAWTAFEEALEAPLTHVEELRALLMERADIDLSDV